MTRSTRTAVALCLITGLTFSAGAVLAHPDHGGHDEPVLEALTHQHGGEDGHLDPVRRNVRLVGKLDLFGEDEQPGRVADVAAYGNYAYLGSFNEPACDTQENGVFVIDISNPAQPTEAGFIPTTPQSWVGEGVQVLDMNTSAFDGQVLIHSNESCTWATSEVHSGLGGISLWDVTDPTNPEALAQHVGDPGTTRAQMHQVHSAFGWDAGDKAYVVMTDDDEAFVATGTDVDIMDITDPSNPVLIKELHLRAQTTERAATPTQEAKSFPPPRGNNVFLHDMVVKEIDGRQIMLLSYWDGGYVLMDVTDPRNPVFLRDTDFAATEPFAAEMNLPADAPPEGNAHQAEFSFDNRYFLGADEDFNARSLLGRITTGTYAGEAFAATQRQTGTAPLIDADSPLEGKTTFVGDACTPLAPATTPIALIERGGGASVAPPTVSSSCTYSQKMLTAEAAGYDGVVVFNDRSTCETVPANPLFAGNIPGVAIARSTGFKILGQDVSGDVCTTATPAVGTSSSDVRVAMELDGWGYLHLFDTQTMQDLDQYAIPESLDADFAEGHGDLSIHEVAMDPKRNLAYISYYSGGFRVVSFGADGIREIGAFIAEGGNNFWGVEYHRLPGAKSPVILASDRDSGLWIFQVPKGL